MKPTKEQEQKFWEWCILNLLELPDLDLNNLFKYAVPKVKAWALGNSYPDKRLTLCLVSMNNKGGEAEAETPALALFWAIYKVMEEK